MQNLATIAALAALFVVVWIVRSPWFKGALGERRVRRSLRTRLDQDEYRVFHDLTLPVRDGTTQIDHIIVSQFGVFVIETKNMKGWIFGSADHALWTQVVFRWKSKFQNPLRQNYKHVKAVQELLRIKAHTLHSVVAFVGAAIPKSAMPAGVVWGARPLADYIKSMRVTVLSEEEVHACSEALASGDFRSTIRTRKTHVRHVKTEVATTCPRCNAPLVERTNRQSGARFLSCSTYPRCKGTRQLT